MKAKLFILNDEVELVMDDTSTFKKPKNVNKDEWVRTVIKDYIELNGVKNVEVVEYDLKKTRTNASVMLQKDYPKTTGVKRLLYEKVLRDRGLPLTKEGADAKAYKEGKVSLKPHTVKLAEKAKSEKQIPKKRKVRIIPTDEMREEARKNVGKQVTFDRFNGDGAITATIKAVTKDKRNGNVFYRVFDEEGNTYHKLITDETILIF